MKLRRLHVTLIGSAILVLVGAGVFLWVDSRGTPARVPEVVVQSHPAAAIVPEVANEPQKIDALTPPPAVAARVAPLPSKVLQTLPTPVAPQTMAGRFEEISALADASKEVIRKRIDADPELSEVLKPSSGRSNNPWHISLTPRR